MKPNFALNLSHDGISLLHRAKAGWMRVGEVALDDPDLNDHLKILRKTAADLDSGGLTSKLVIPNSQVLYTEIEAPGPDTAARISQIRDGLVGLTPYDVSDLHFDWRMSGTRAHVAVVARETLQEAEAFAAEFRFNPVSFVAIPVNGIFDGEPFFGATDHAAALLTDGEAIEPDTQRMAVLGPGTVGAASADTVPDAVAEPEPGQKAEPAPQADPAEEPRPVPPEPARAARAKPRVKRKPKAAPRPPPADTPPEAEPLTFSSRRKEPPLVLASGSAGADAAPSPAPSAVIEPVPAPVVAGTAAVAAPEISPEADTPVWRRPNGRDTTPMPMTAAHTADVEDPADRRRGARDSANAAGSALAGALGKLGQGTAATLRRPAERKAAIAASDTEADAMTVFGARGHSRQPGKPRYLGLILTVALLLGLAVLALWSTYYLDDRSTALPPPAESDSPQIAATDPAQPVTRPPAAEAVLPEVTAETTPEPAAPERQPEPAQPAAPAPDDRIDAAVAEALTEAPPAQISASEAEPDPEELADRELEMALLQQPASTALDTPAPDQVARPPPTRAEAETSYAATGIWQLDPEPLPEATGGDRLEDIYVASIDPVISSQDAIALPDARGLGNDLRPASLLPPPALGNSFDLDARGLVRASPEGTLSPDGVRIFSGTPSVAPGPRPGSALPVAAAPATATPTAEAPAQPETAAEPVDAERERLRRIRPRLRPDTLQETNERSRLGGFSLAELATIRPTARPPSAQEAVQAALQEALQTPAPGAAAAPATTENATDFAVVASLQPRTRPSDFSSTVQKALEEASLTPSVAAPAPVPAPAPDVAAPRVPSIPSRASVTKRATERNAINLSKVNLIGVYGSPSDRRALVRLKSGRYVKVEVGDRVDGGRVAAIGNDELRYVKRGRNITLKMPKG